MKQASYALLIFTILFNFYGCEKNNMDRGKDNTLVENGHLYRFAKMKGLLFFSQKRFGFINQEGEIVIKPIYEYANPFKDNYTEVRYKNRAGLINLQGDFVLDPRYDELSYVGNKLVEVKKHAKDKFYGLMNLNGHWIVEPVFDEIKPFHDGLAAVQRDGRWGYINTSGQIVIEPQFDYVTHFENDIAHVDFNDKRGIINKKGEFIVPPIYEERIVAFQKEFFPIEEDNRWGFVNKNGVKIIEPQFVKVELFNEELAAVQVDHKWGFIDKNGNIVIKPQFEDVQPFVKGLAKVKIDGESWYIDKSGKKIKRAILNYTNVPEYHEGLARVFVHVNKDETKVGYIDYKRNVVIPPQFDYGEDFHEGFAVVSNDVPTSYDDVYGIIDKHGNYLIPFARALKKATSFRGGLAYIEEKSGRWGYINKRGEYIWE